MTFSLAFWILMLLWLVLQIRSSWPFAGPASYYSFAPWLLLFFIIGLLGWGVFGAPLHR